MMQNLSVTGALLSVAAFVSLAGCSGNADPVEGVSVSGTIKLDGQPLQSGTINFIPTDGKSPTSGGTISDGSYSVKVPLGRMKIAVSSPKVVGKEKAYDTPDSPEIDITEEAIPVNYNVDTKLSHDVTASTNDLNFDLKTTE